MSRETELEQTATHKQGHAPGHDIDGEHDQSRARQVSNAKLKQVAEADKVDPQKAHDTADISAYTGFYTHVQLTARRMYSAGDQINAVLNAPADEGGVW